MKFTLYVDGNDNIVELAGLRDALTLAFINTGATVEVSIQDANDMDVSGPTFPVTMNYIALSDGLYRATLDKALAIVDGVPYKAKITVAASEGDAEWSIDFIAKRRTA